MSGVLLALRSDGITAAERRVGVGYCARGYVLWGVTTEGMCARYLGAPVRFVLPDLI